MALAEIINIGDELLIGQTVNTNASWLGEQLALSGIDLHRVTVIADKRDSILHELAEAEKRSDIVLITGGLGPTRDDVTKHVLCEYFNTELERNHEILQRIEQYFISRGREVLESNRMQADLPKSCVIIPNLHGTASGMWFNKDGKVFVSMPGVPYEMTAMVTNEVIPRLQQQYQLAKIHHRTIMTQGIGESFLAEQISDWESRIYRSGMGLAYLPSPGLVRLRITARDIDNAAEQTEAFAQELEARLPQYVYGRDADTLEEVVGRMLRENKATLSTAESCTGGGIAAKITSVSGSSEYFLGSVVAYSNNVKKSALHIQEQTLTEHGAVSEQVVREMAASVCQIMQTDYSIAVSGIAGPLGGTPEKPVGTVWIAVSGKGVCNTKMFQFGGTRDRIIAQTILSSLNMLRLLIKS
jgi:nicotinamide-nucleotide amidase